MVGVRMLYACRYRDALNHFQEAVVLEPGAKGYLSYLGLAVAHAERKFSDAEQLCRRAIEAEYHRPEHYHNLGEVFLLANRRGDAVKAFNQALSWNPNHEASSDCLRKLGIRKPPVLAVLPRNHPLNVMLGKALRRGKKSRNGRG
jgi:tetratricopeptide (TPR) repeat protein